MKNAAFIQARMGSTRLPGKMLRSIHGKTLLEWVLAGVGVSHFLDDIILCTSVKQENDPIVEKCESLGVKVFRGSEDDVLGRFVAAVNHYNVDNVIRVCADNPFVNGYEIDRLISFFNENQYDYAFNHIPKLENRYPDGFGAEICRSSVLKEIDRRDDLSLEEREHVTKFIWDRSLHKIGVLEAREEIAYPNVRLDIDTEEDFTRISSFIDLLKKENINHLNITKVCERYQLL